jgi:type IV pilus assembly protein PilX
MTAPLPFRRAPARTQRGIVLFVALIAMVVMSLAAVALLRAVDSGTSIAGNLAFKQASIGPVNYAIEQANYNLFDAPAAARITNPFIHAAGYNYYANLQPGESATGIPAGLYGHSYAYPTGFTTYTDPTTGYEVRWIIERMCQGTAPLPGPFTGDPLSDDGLKACDMLVPKVALGRTTMKLLGIPVPPVPLYRVTVRVDGPSNTVTYAQAVLR